MELKDFVGLHKLSGVDMNNERTESEWGGGFEDCQVVNFILDGKVYTAIENPSDGYRSMLREIKLSDAATRTIKNRFSPVRVIGIIRDGEVLDLFDVHTGKAILSIGTKDENDYYPVFVAEFTPENMAINQGGI
jgi:hypothetical protein